jgi:hypothetical protein
VRVLYFVLLKAGVIVSLLCLVMRVVCRCRCKIIMPLLPLSHRLCTLVSLAGFQNTVC